MTSEYLVVASDQLVASCDYLIVTRHIGAMTGGDQGVLGGEV